MQNAKKHIPAAERVQKALSTAASSAASLIKMGLRSRPVGRAMKKPQERELVVLGNGPSLSQTLAGHRDWLSARDLMAVNFAANSDEFFRLMPGHYVLADPHFFHGADSDPNVARLWENIRRADWPMTLHVPAAEQRRAEQYIAKRGHISVHPYNLTPVEGYAWLRRAAYARGLGMPRPRNVLIPSLMLGLNSGYRTIYIAGADHSWSRTLWVDDANRVVSIQPHFYPDSEKERERVASEYAGYHLHDIYTSLAIAFRSYFDIAGYAATLGARIINITPGSFIDAFPRAVPPASSAEGKNRK